MQKIMNRTTWLVVGLLAVATAGPIAAVDKGDAAPPWQARDFAGHTVDFPAVAEGKPTVVVFWATWCPYCRAFMPYLKNIQADYAQYGVKVVRSAAAIRRPTCRAWVSRRSRSHMATRSRRPTGFNTFRAS